MRRVKLGEICEINIGKTPSRSEKSFWNGEFCWLSISDMKSKFLSQTKEKITDKAINSTNMKIVRKGTVVMSFKLSIGKVAILSEDMYTNEAIANFVIKNNYDILTDYLYYALQSLKFDHLGDRAVMGKTLNKVKLNNLSIVFYEPNEQRKIVDKLDVISNLIDYRQKQFKELSDLVKSRFIEFFGHPETNEKGWKINTFADICTVRQGLQIPISKRLTEYEENCYEYITVQYLHGGKEQEYIKCPKSTVICNKEDILMTRTGNTGMVVTGVDGVFHNNFFLIDFDRNRYDKNFLVQYLNLDIIQTDIRRRAGTSTIPDLNHSEFYKIPVFEPPIELQIQFNNFIKQVDKSQLAIKKSLEELETLKKSLMQAYFG